MSPIELRGQFPTLSRIGIGIARITGKALRFIIPALLVLAVAHGIAIVIQGRRVEARLREIKSRGEIVSLSEFGKPKVPDAENAAVVYARAFKALLVSPEGGTGYLDDFLKPSKRAADPGLWDRARQIVSVNGEAVGLVKEAVERPKCQFPTNWEAGFEATFPEFMHLRTLSRLLTAGAIIDGRDGRMNEAVKRIELSLKMSNSLGDQTTIIGQLVRMALLRQSATALRDVMSYGRITEDQASDLDRVLADIRMGPGFVKAMESERALGVWLFDLVRKNPLDMLRLSEGEVTRTSPGAVSKLLRYLWRPVLYGDELFYLKRMDGAIALSALPYRKTASDYEKMSQDGDFPRWAVVSRMVAPAFGRARMRADEAEAEASGSRIVLALQVYKGRYGSYPATLDELGSKLGRELPKDPFSGKAFIYRREGQGFLLYSIGGNLQDDKAEAVKYVRGETRHPAQASQPPSGGPKVNVAQVGTADDYAPSIPEPHYGDEPKYGDIVWRMRE